MLQKVQVHEESSPTYIPWFFNSHTIDGNIDKEAFTINNGNQTYSNNIVTGAFTSAEMLMTRWVFNDEQDTVWRRK